MATLLGNLESQLLAYAQMRCQQSFRSQEVADALGISATQARELLSRLARRNLIARVRRGLYLLPSRIPPGGRGSPGEFLALATLMKDRGAKYQICGLAAFHRYGWDEQVPNRLDVYNTAISGDRTIGAVNLTLIKVKPSRIGDTETIETPDGIEAIYSSRARTLVDAIYDWSRFGGLPRAYDWVRKELARDSKMTGRIVAAAIAYGNKSTIRRLGKLMEVQGVSERQLNKLEKQLGPTSALIPWCPTRAKKGTVDRRWGVIFNE